MFCEKCGTKNEEGAKFCEACGNPIETQSTTENDQVQNNEQITQTQYAQPSIPKVKKPLTKKQKIIMVFSGVLVVLGVAFYLVGSNLSNPERIVEGYFKSKIGYNWEDTYDYLDITAGEYTSKEMYSKMLNATTKDVDKKDILNYSISEADSTKTSSDSDSIYNLFGGSESGTTNDSADSDNELLKYYKVEYTEKGSSTKQTEYIILIKQKNKSWLFFDSYKVAVDDIVAKTYNINVPSGAKLFIDDVEINKSNIVKSDSSASSSSSTTNINFDNYKISNIFAGQHDIKVTAPYMEDYTKSLNITDGEIHRITDTKIADSAINELTKKSEELLNLVYSSAIQGKSFDEIKSNFTTNDKQLNTIKSTYDDLCSSVKKSDGTGLKSIAFSEFKKSGTNTSISNNLTYEISANFKYTYTSIRNSYFSDTPTQEYTPTSLNSGRLNIYYVYENEKWVGYSMYMYVSWY